MAKPRKWAEVIKAWADGKPIQSKDIKFDVFWSDWDTDTPPFWATNLEWRIKPAIYKYRMVLEQNLNTKTYWVTATDDPTIESSDFFVRWLTDWIEIELPHYSKMS
jgi:hypothetical protein